MSAYLDILFFTDKRVVQSKMEIHIVCKEREQSQTNRVLCKFYD